MLKLITILSIIALGANCASVAGISIQNCAKSGANFLQSLKCLLKLSEFIDILDQVDFDDKAKLNELNKSCADFQNCLTSFQCDEDEEKRKIADITKNTCNFISFQTSDEFLKCANKLRNSKCYESFEPIQNNEQELDIDKKLEICDNTFGTENCLKEELNEICGKEIWEKTRNNVLALNNITYCDNQF